MINQSAKAPKHQTPPTPTRNPNMTDKPKKRIVMPQKTNQVEQSDVTVVPTLNSLINDALAIVGAELAGYRSKTKRGVSLDLKEARVVTGYLDALTRASKESREQARAEDLADLTNEELLQLASQIANSAQDLQLQSTTKDEENEAQ